jgi:opine dehydrogenase
VNQNYIGEPTGFAVLGAGNGGIAMAGHLAVKGFHVALWNRSPERLEPLQRNRLIHLVADREGLPDGKGHLAVVSTDMAKCLAEAKVIMVVVPATGHTDVAVLAAPHLRDGQVLVLHPGRTGGALEFLATVRRQGCTADVTIAEAQTLLYACRAENPGQVRIFGYKNSVPVAAIPAHRTPDVIRALSAAYEEFIPGDNVMKTSLDNIGAIFHPAVTVLNSARIETTRGNFEYYIEGISRSVARVLERIDAERVRVGGALGFHCMTAREWLYIAYGAAGKTLFDAIRANEGYYGIKAPHSVDHRYITEDVPTSLVPIASIGEELGVPCPTIRSIVHLANLIHDCDYWETGRTARSMGLKGRSVEQIRRIVLEGRLPGTGAKRASSVQLQSASKGNETRKRSAAATSGVPRS